MLSGTDMGLSQRVLSSEQENCQEVTNIGQVCQSDVLKTVSTYITEQRVTLAETEGHVRLGSQPNPNGLPSPDGDGCCGSANPYVPAPSIAITVLVLNVFLPGVGTICSAYYDPTGCNCKTITCGIFQLLLTIILVGWIWSICQGAAIYKKSIKWQTEQDNNANQNTKTIKNQ